MSEIVKLIEKIEDKVWKSGCGYLYEYYDELVRLLEAVGKENLTGEEIGSLRGWSASTHMKAHGTTALR